MKDKEHKEPCNCKECGRDLHSDANIMLEVKATMDACMNDVVPEFVGRPMYVVLIGEDGLCVKNSPSFGGGDKILVDCLKQVIHQLKVKPRTRG
jgi:hypothetical protein